MSTITKREVAERVAKRTGQPQLVVKQIIQVLFDEVITDMIQGNRLEFRDFGVFEVIKRRPRTGRNPKTGQKVGVPAKRVVTFKMGKLMKERVASLSSEVTARDPAEAAPEPVEPSVPVQPPGDGSPAL